MITLPNESIRDSVRALSFGTLHDFTYDRGLRHITYIQPLHIYRTDKFLLSPVYCMASANDHSRHFPVLELPLELRHAVYRYVLVVSSRKVVIVSTSVEGRSVAKMRFYTTRDLSLLETNKQIRIEAGHLFYAEGIFTLCSYRRTQEYGQKPLYGEKCFQISLDRVRKCHLLTPSGTAPLSHCDCLKDTQDFRILLQGFVDALTEGHCMRHLLIESYQFERAVIFEKQTMQCDITWTLEPLERLRGLGICHIRAMKMCHWPYLRFLEGQIMRSYSEPGQSDNKGAICNEPSKSAGINNSFGDPHPNKIYNVFGIEPLYRDLEFLQYYEDDILF